MINRIFIVVLISAFTSIVAQNNEAVDKKAKAILDELSAKTKTYTTIKADFNLTIEGKDKKVKESQSGFMQLKGVKYKLDLKGQEIISDGKTIWTYLKDAKEVQINTIDEKSPDAFTPSAMFTIFETGFKSKFEKEEVKNGKTTQIINLYPLNPDKKKFHTAKLYIDKVKKQILIAKMLMKDGSTYIYTIKNFKTNEEIADAVFTFDKKAYPGVEVVDLRE
ncbi:MAG: outer membrane lipoprotein carrier protein LolA [Bacteroidetes bacterium]|nr:outer membrane lipoprotein carrier protein LolA [Bacteroidota bacterium]